MTGAELKTFCQESLDMDELSDTVFFQLANVAKTKIEEERNWKILETDDNSQTASIGDTFLTTKTLPSNFGNDIGLFVTNSNNQPIEYAPIPYKERYQYKDASRRYWIDIANETFGLTGKLPSGFTTIHLIYRKVSTDIASGTSWVFPSRFHAIIGFLISEMYKGGGDYDEISAREALQNRADASVLYQALIDWDTAIRLKEMNEMYDRQGGYGADGLPEADVYEFPLGLM
jgi:hypothetical protein